MQSLIKLVDGFSVDEKSLSSGSNFFLVASFYNWVACNTVCDTRRNRTPFCKRSRSRRFQWVDELLQMNYKLDACMRFVWVLFVLPKRNILYAVRVITKRSKFDIPGTWHHFKDLLQPYCPKTCFAEFDILMEIFNFRYWYIVNGTCSPKI